MLVDKYLKLPFEECKNDVEKLTKIVINNPVSIETLYTIFSELKKMKDEKNERKLASKIWCLSDHYCSEQKKDEKFKLNSKVYDYIDSKWEHD